MHCRGRDFGLTAAYRLRALVGDDVTITVFDPADRLGGVLRTERVGGQPVDVGAEAFVVRRRKCPRCWPSSAFRIDTWAPPGAPTDLQPRPAAPVAVRHHRRDPVVGGSDGGIGRRGDGGAHRRGTRRPLDWRAGDDPVTAALVADRFGPQVVADRWIPCWRSLCRLSRHHRSALGRPGLAMALDGGAASLTDAVRAALPAVTDGPVFGAVDGGYAVLVDELIRRSGLSWERVGVERIEPAGPGWTLCDGAVASGGLTG
ncbi:NAD(P)-binding Rossmann-like domain protein [Mycobacterium xenopi 4042]|uniref:NAD(P)-binding Rossmann-like domain protein n=1 Tax=Mycobacterium xenopi 4042 TaxID=1299334 RepID=X8CDI4_MYCXE|nr:NAD(P)-binding Rossmann-like domain protein [Mycobacterium xenopi 4042]